MKKILDFCKSHALSIKWTLEYFVFLGILLKFLFNFNILSAYQWWRFFHATLHGFGGLVFGTIIYSAIPIYIATMLIIHRKKEPIITLPFFEKIKSFFAKIFEKIKSLISTPTASFPATEEKTEPEPAEEKSESPEYPSDMPPEMRVPYIRMKHNMSLIGVTSTFNKQSTPVKQPEPEKPENESFPIPSDFDIFDSLPDETPTNSEFSGDDFPVFKDLDFDTPVPEPAHEALVNSATKYFTAHNIEYETYHDFVATEKYLVYDHNDGDFWIMDDDAWFASKKQRESPIPELLELAKQNDLIPVLYMESQNIMDFPGTMERFESMGIRVVKSLDELK